MVRSFNNVIIGSVHFFLVTVIIVKCPGKHFQIIPSLHCSVPFHFPFFPVAVFFMIPGRIGNYFNTNVKNVNLKVILV